MIYFIDILAIVLFMGAFSPSEQKDYLKISVYYETYCSDSINFIKDQLTPMMGEFNRYPDWLTLDLLPFGNAKKTGEHKYTCQHGTRECQGNKMDACAINQLVTEETPPLYMRLVNFIYCTMNAEDQINAARKCCRQTNVDYSKLMKCFKGPDGDKLIDMYANRTASLQPPLKWVPTIVFNDKFNQSESDRAQSNLYSVVCSFVPDQCD